MSVKPMAGIRLLGKRAKQRACYTAYSLILEKMLKSHGKEDNTHHQ